MRSNILINFFALFLSLAASAADSDFKVYYPKHRLAEELVQIGQGILPGAKLSAMDSRVIISASPQGIKDALKLFRELDRPARKFLIKLRAQGVGAGQEDSAGVSGSMNAGPVKISKAQNKSGATASIGGVSVTGNSRNYADSGDTTQSVEVMEGSTAVIHWNGQNMVVKPRALGNGTVQMELTQENGIATSTSLPQRKWQNVGGVSESRTGTQKEILGKSSQENQQRKDFQLYVQEVK